jgi:hypothetical protein
MKRALKLSSVCVCLYAALFLAGCGDALYGPASGSVGYGLYHGYDYPYHRYGPYYYDDRDVRVDRDAVQQRRQQWEQNSPARRQNFQAARSRAASMGRPAGMRGRGGRR